MRPSATADWPYSLVCASEQWPRIANLRSSPVLLQPSRGGARGDPLAHPAARDGMPRGVGFAGRQDGDDRA
jgi:hypothetical protein